MGHLWSRGSTVGQSRDILDQEINTEARHMASVVAKYCTGRQRNKTCFVTTIKKDMSSICMRPLIGHVLNIIKFIIDVAVSFDSDYQIRIVG